MLGKKNGSPKRFCIACGGRSRSLNDGLCQTCYDQADMSESLRSRHEESKPDGFWSKMFWFFTLFDLFVKHESEDGEDR